MPGNGIHQRQPSCIMSATLTEPRREEGARGKWEQVLSHHAHAHDFIRHLLLLVVERFV